MDGSSTAKHQVGNNIFNENTFNRQSSDSVNKTFGQNGKYSPVPEKRIKVEKLERRKSKFKAVSVERVVIITQRKYLIIELPHFKQIQYDWGKPRHLKK